MPGRGGGDEHPRAPIHNEHFAHDEENLFIISKLLTMDKHPHWPFGRSWRAFAYDEESSSS